MQVSHKGSKNQTTWTIACCLSWCILAGNWNQDLGLAPRPSEKGMQVSQIAPQPLCEQLHPGNLFWFISRLMTRKRMLLERGKKIDRSTWKYSCIFPAPWLGRTPCTLSSLSLTHMKLSKLDKHDWQRILRSPRTFLFSEEFPLQALLQGLPCWSLALYQSLQEKALHTLCHWSKRSGPMLYTDHLKPCSSNYWDLEDRQMRIRSGKKTEWFIQKVTTG